MDQQTTAAAGTADVTVSSSSVGAGRELRGPVRLGRTRIVVALLARIVLLTVVGLGVWGAGPALLGWHPTTVVTGSMSPRLLVGDVAVSRPADPDRLTIGQVLLFDDPDHADRLRMHRFVAVDADGRLITRGDANDADDSSHVDRITVHGIGTLRVPYLGVPVVWLHQGRVVLVVALALVLLLLVALSGLDRPLLGPVAPAAPAAPTTAAGITRPAARPRRVLVHATVILVAALAALGVALTAFSTPSWSAYGARTTASATLGAADYFSCASAAVRDDADLAWTLDSTAATIADTSGNGRTGAATGTRSAITGPCSGNGLSLSSSAYVYENTAAAAPTTMSMEIWFKSSTAGTVAGLSTRKTGSSVLATGLRTLELNSDGSLTFSVGTSFLSGSSVKTTTGSFRDNAWHHVVVTLDGTTVRLSVDGTLRGSGSLSVNPTTTAGYWRVGGDGTLSDPFTGGVAAFAVYPRVLTAAEISGHWNARA